MMPEIHERCQELLPLYVAGQLDAPERNALEAHLAACATCRADLALWQALAAQVITADRAIVAPPGLAEAALRRVQRQRPLWRLVRQAWQLLKAQALLVHRELWPTSAAVMALGVIMALVAQKTEALYFVAPAIAAASLAMSFGPEHDPAYELAAATPTSLWQIMLARGALVSGYNLALALVASLALLIFVPPQLLGAVILSWLGPLTFLSALALLLSLWFGTARALAVSYGLWIAQYGAFHQSQFWQLPPSWVVALTHYRLFWHEPGLLLLLAAILLGAALLSANQLTRRHPGYLAR